VLLSLSEGFEVAVVVRGAVCVDMVVGRVAETSALVCVNDSLVFLTVGAMGEFLRFALVWSSIRR
jgi:hypothetical protein